MEINKRLSLKGRTEPLNTMAVRVYYAPQISSLPRLPVLLFASKWTRLGCLAVWVVRTSSAALKATHLSVTSRNLLPTHHKNDRPKSHTAYSAKGEKSLTDNKPTSVQTPWVFGAETLRTVIRYLKH